MRRSWSTLVSLAIVASTSRSYADGYKTAGPVHLRAKPGEKQELTGDVPANTAVEILEEQGRWRRVKAGKLSGWVARTQLVGGPPPAPGGSQGAWRTHVRGKETAAGGTAVLLVQVVGKVGVVRGAPQVAAASVVEAAPGTHLAVVDARSTPGWIKVRDESGLEGWIARAEVANGEADAAFMRPTRAEEERRAEVRRRARKLALRAAARVGYRSLAMDFHSNGTDTLANYVMSSEATTITADGEVALRPGHRFGASLDARARLGYSAPGIAYTDLGGMTSHIPFSMLEGDLGLRVNMRVGEADVALRAGYHYEALLVDDVENPGRMPRERLAGATLGSRVDLHPAALPFAISARLDVMLAGGRAQTPGLEDGATSTARALWAGLAIHYPLSPRFSLVGVFDYERATTGWTGAGTRVTGATSAHRTDTSQLIEIGLATEL